MPSPLETVTQFLDLWDQPGGVARAIREYFTPDTLWVNEGFTTTRGIDEALGVLSGFGQDVDTLVMRVDTLAIAAQGNKVLTERIDHIVGPDGNPAMSIPLMGIFEVTQDGKISAWRDYFDTKGFAEAQQG